MGFGAGVLISAVAFDLVEEAVDTQVGQWAAVTGIFAGCGVFFGGDWLIDRFGGADRKDAKGAQESGSALAIVLGTVLDGIPESMVIGLTIYQGGAVGAAYLAAVFISNLPEAISSTAGLAAGGGTGAHPLDGRRSRWSRASRRSSATRCSTPADIVAFVLAFAGGAILTMLADTMMPEAFEHGGKLVGVDDARLRRRARHSHARVSRIDPARLSRRSTGAPTGRPSRPRAGGPASSANS